MNIKTFIHRPLLSMVISVIIVLLGVISLLSLPVERYPDIAPPAIYVWASYPGASAETVQKSMVGVGAGANIFVQLKPWGERKGSSHSSTAVMEKISELMAEETEAQSFVSEPGMVEGYGGNGGFVFSVQGRNGQDVKTLHGGQ